MNQFRKCIFFAFVACSIHAFAQKTHPVKIFYDTRVVNGHSVEMIPQGNMKFIISHRFGRVNSGAYELFGLDNSTIRMGLDYGLTKNINIGLGRNSFQKTYDSYFKLNLLQQSESQLFSVTALAGIAIKTLKNFNPESEIPFKHRLFYNYNIMIASRLNDRISLQLTPSLIHRNLVQTHEEKHGVLALGTALRYLAFKRVTLSAEYFYVLPNQLAVIYQNSLAIGVNIETKGHVFQLHFGNSRGMTEKFFITETTGKWSKGDIHFGFNITRDFKIKSRKDR